MNPSGFYVDPNARSERAQKKIPLRNNLRGIIEVPGEPLFIYFVYLFSKI